MENKNFINLVEEKAAQATPYEGVDRGIRLDSTPLTMEEQFAARLAQLRQEKGVSAHEMSLALNLSDTYINRVERRMMLPSLSVFFKICDYFHIAPAEWFDSSNASAGTYEALAKLNMLSEEERGHIFALIDILVQKKGQ